MVESLLRLKKFFSDFMLIFCRTKGRNYELENIFEKYSNKLPNQRVMVTHLDVITSENVASYSGTRNFSKRKTLHFVFIGDSRIRQHFLNVLKVIIIIRNLC
jgi:hypothetical protein